MFNIARSAAAAGVLATAFVAASSLSASAVEGGDELGPSKRTLEQLSEVQTRAEIDALVDSTVPVRLLVDAATGRVEAAVPISARALTPVGPGCTSTSVCMKTNSGVPYGLTGSGTKTGSWKKIIRISSGDRRTSFWASNGMAYEYRANSDVVMNVTVTVTKVQR
ncbi:hypothetical protein P9139_15515 [Curtobacterium flaccumfaciens]|nr:hypothetical protein P9139_15515 [Curtobacterium flaccumfaciens]